MAIYQSEQVLAFLAKATSEGKVVAHEDQQPVLYVSQTDGLILPNGDIHDRGHRFYAWTSVPAAAPKAEPKVEPKAEPEVEPKVEETKVEEPATPAPKTRKPTAKKVAE